MLDSRQTITAWLATIDDLTDLNVSFVQEDGFSTETEKPTIVIVYDGSDEESGTLFRNERWDFWLVAESGDYYTLGLMAQILRKNLDRKTPAGVDGQETTILRMRWSGDGPAVLDTQYRVHTQIQSYIALVFDTA